MTVQDSVPDTTETVSSANPTEARGEDGAKLFLGVIKSYTEYEVAQLNRDQDNRPTSVFFDGLGKDHLHEKSIFQQLYTKKNCG